ncbi:unnamed protein product [Scytosiphon promiscuus]
MTQTTSRRASGYRSVEGIYGKNGIGSESIHGAHASAPFGIYLFADLAWRSRSVEIGKRPCSCLNRRRQTGLGFQIGVPRRDADDRRARGGYVGVGVPPFPRRGIKKRTLGQGKTACLSVSFSCNGS